MSGPAYRHKLVAGTCRPLERIDQIERRRNHFGPEQSSGWRIRIFEPQKIKPAFRQKDIQVSLPKIVEMSRHDKTLERSINSAETQAIEGSCRSLQNRVA